MTKKPLLPQAQQHRDSVLLAELGAWLHDLGKLSRQFVESKTDPAYVTSDAGQEAEKEIEAWPHGAVLTQDREKIPEELWKLLNQSHSTILGEFSLSGLISDHHLTKPGHILALLKQADRNDSGEDEYNAAGLPQLRPVQRATVFGQEDALDLSPLDDLRRSLYAPLETLMLSSPYDRDKVWQLLRPALNGGLGKTQRAANDIRLDQHVWGVASRFKAFVIRDLLDPPAAGAVRNTFRLLSVQWNAWEAITPFARLSDVAGRVAMIARVREALCQAIDTEYAIGNRIYEDDDGIHFLVADLEWGTELETLARGIVNCESGGELLPGASLSDPTTHVTLLAQQMAKMRKTLPIVGEPAWLEAWQKRDVTELCPVCLRRPISGEVALCGWCARQRRAGAEQRRAKSGTLQTGELADARGKTALILTRFDLDYWLTGDLLHTLFITSPKDMAQSQELADAQNWNWQRLQTALQQTEMAMAELDSYEAAVKQAEDALTSKCKDLQEQYKQEDNEKTKRQGFVTNTGMPAERKQVLLAECDHRLRDTMTRIAALEVETVAFRAQLEAIRQQPLSPEAHIARFLKKYSRLDKAAEIVAEIAKDCRLSPDDTLLLALVRKNPSAGRLLRVWQTTEEFLQAQADALAGAVGAKRQRAVLTLEGKAPQDGYYTAELPVLGTVEVLVRADGKVQTTTFVKPEQMARFQKTASGAPLRWVSGETELPADTARIRDVRSESYAPYQVITVSPNLLLAMVPADRALEIAQGMQTAYAAEFSKVQGRVPFHVGLAFMDAHYPMFAALDTARRLAETFHTLGNQWMEAKVEAKTPETPEAENYTLQLNSERFGTWQWTISAHLGNNAPDWYHPYVLIKAGAGLEQRGMSLQGPYGRWVHIAEVQEGDSIGFLPNLFDFVSLDTVSRRLEAGLLPDATRRVHPLLGPRHSPRPYLLERVSRLAEVWNAICVVPGMSESRLAAATTLLARKWEDWQLSQQDTHRAEYEWLVKQTVARDFAGNPVIERAILEGLYFDVIDLYRHILKQTVEKSQLQSTEEAA
ncbi:MAG: hypothetical protein JW892_10395 [Anaerolineae bacterium]|nr:hypothetical protein [Anaerolineae bacterium]